MQGVRDVPSLVEVSGSMKRSEIDRIENPPQQPVTNHQSPTTNKKK